MDSPGLYVFTHQGERPDCLSVWAAKPSTELPACVRNRSIFSAFVTHWAGY